MTISQASLDGGIRVVSDRMDSVESVSIGVWVNAGARNEDASNNGVSHLLEHMAFRGTSQRSSAEIATEIENVGGHLNAYTSRETTVYYATVLKEDVDLALDIISDIVLNSTFDEEELDRERGVVLQEIGQANDTPDDIIFDLFQETAFPDQPLGRPILGTVDTVREISRQTLVEYISAQYGGNRMVIAAAGNLDPEDLVLRSQELFAGVSASSASEPPAGEYHGGYLRDNRDLEQAHLVMGFNGIGFGDDDYYPLAVLSTALGGGMSSRLFQEIRENRGLVYSIYTFSSAFTDGGIFGLYAGTGEEKIHELVSAASRELRRVAEDPIDDGELARSRAQIKAGVLMSLESTSSRAERLARHLITHDRIVSVEEISSRIDAVSAEDIRRVAGRLLASAPTVTAIGPVGNMPDYDTVKVLLNG
ncbi:MAG: pitrilysin family protein [Pseudomonadota bacterium]|nr:pitrilysin family protein [Pseudomonadota bacterium]